MIEANVAIAALASGNRPLTEKGLFIDQEKNQIDVLFSFLIPIVITICPFVL